MSFIHLGRIADWGRGTLRDTLDVIILNATVRRVGSGLVKDKDRI